MISFIIATYNRPQHLKVLLYSLLAQTDGDWEAIVMDEGDNKANLPYDPRIKHYKFDRIELDPNGRGTVGLLAKDAGLKYATGEFVSFPSEDIYYVPHFVQIMKNFQAASNADLVYCDFLFTAPEYNTYYQVFSGAPVHGRIDSCNYILRKSCIGDTKFGKWVYGGKDGKINIDHGIADGLFIEELIKKWIVHCKAPGVLVAKN